MDTALVKKVVFKEPNGRTFSMEIGLQLTLKFIKETAQSIIDDLYHLEDEKPTYEIVL